MSMIYFYYHFTSQTREKWGFSRAKAIKIIQPLNSIAKCFAQRDIWFLMRISLVAFGVRDTKPISHWHVMNQYEFIGSYKNSEKKQQWKTSHRKSKGRLVFDAAVDDSILNTLCISIIITVLIPWGFGFILRLASLIVCRELSTLLELQISSFIP